MKLLMLIGWALSRYLVLPIRIQVSFSLPTYLSIMYFILEHTVNTIIILIPPIAEEPTLEHWYLKTKRILNEPLKRRFSTIVKTTKTLGRRWKKALFKYFSLISMKKQHRESTFTCVLQSFEGAEGCSRGGGFVLNDTYPKLFLFISMRKFALFYMAGFEKESLSVNRVESWKKKVVLFISLFERRDDENRLAAEKMFLNKFFINKIDSFVRFYIPLNAPQCFLFV